MTGQLSASEEVLHQRLNQRLAAIHNRTVALKLFYRYGRLSGFTRVLVGALMLGLVGMAAGQAQSNALDNQKRPEDSTFEPAESWADLVRRVQVPPHILQETYEEQQAIWDGHYNRTWTGAQTANDAALGFVAGAEGFVKSVGKLAADIGHTVGLNDEVDQDFWKPINRTRTLAGGVIDGITQFGVGVGVGLGLGVGVGYLTSTALRRCHPSNGDGGSEALSAEGEADHRHAGTRPEPASPHR